MTTTGAADGRLWSALSPILNASHAAWRRKLQGGMQAQSKEDWLCRL